jgi:hypothetical protein
MTNSDILASINAPYIRSFGTGRGLVDRLPPNVWLDVLQIDARGGPISEAQSDMELSRLSQVCPNWTLLTHVLQDRLRVCQSEYRQQIAVVMLLRLSGDVSRRIKSLQITLQDELCREDADKTGIMIITPILLPVGNMIGEYLTQLSITSHLNVNPKHLYHFLDILFGVAASIRMLTLNYPDFGRSGMLEDMTPVISPNIKSGLAVLERLVIIAPRGDLGVFLNSALLKCLRCLKLAQGLDKDLRSPKPSLEYISLPSSLLSLDLTGFKFNTEEMGNLSKLREFTFKKEWIHHSDINFILDFVDLKEVSLSGKVAYSTVDALLKVPRLCLALSLINHDECNKNALIELGNMIKSLEISSLDVQFLTLIPGLCPNLRSLSLSGSESVFRSLLGGFSTESEYVRGLGRLESFCVNGRRVELK